MYDPYQHAKLDLFHDSFLGLFSSLANVHMYLITRPSMAAAKRQMDLMDTHIVNINKAIPAVSPKEQPTLVLGRRFHSEIQFVMRRLKRASGSVNILDIESLPTEKLQTAFADGREKAIQIGRVLFNCLNELYYQPHPDHSMAAMRYHLTDLEGILLDLREAMRVFEKQVVEDSRR